MNNSDAEPTPDHLEGAPAISYRTLKSVSHEHDRVQADAEERARRASPSAVHWTYPIGDRTMFCVLTTGIAVLLEQTMSLEREALSVWGRLPQGVQSHYLHSMIVEEIQATNEIEHVRSSRQEITAALESLSEDDPTQSKRFREMVRLYLALGRHELTSPTSLDGIRSLYDEVLADEIREGDLPDGIRFRRSSVDVTSGQRTVHSGILPESAIEDGLTAMLDQSRTAATPRLIRAVAGHFIFEHVHPFYDGNGRLGRFLLALDLSQILSPVAWLSLSTTIADNKDRYYRAFTDSEHPLNRGDVTPFIETMLSIIAESLRRLNLDLAGRRDKLDALSSLMDGIALPSASRVAPSPTTDLATAADQTPSADEDLRAALFILGQATLFGPTGELTLEELAAVRGRSKQFVRPHTRHLERLGLIEPVSRRPLKFRLTASGRTLIGLDS